MYVSRPAYITRSTCSMASVSDNRVLAEAAVVAVVVVVVVGRAVAGMASAAADMDTEVAAV